MHGSFVREIHCGVQRQRKYVLDNSLFNILKITTTDSAEGASKQLKYDNHQTFIK